MTDSYNNAAVQLHGLIANYICVASFVENHGIYF